MDSTARPHDASVVVFLGPSCPRREVAAIVAADVRPPARKGDFYRLLATDVTVIVLIDGVFHGAPSVWHREILAAVDEGIIVIGASSMGALRASELHDLGVEGSGTIFEWYRDGYIDGDDEVALHHGPEDSEYVALSEPLVNIRATLKAAVQDGCLTEARACELADEARATYYPERSFRGLVNGDAARRWSLADRDAITSFFRGSRVDLKYTDALGALDRARQIAQHRALASRRPRSRRRGPTLDLERIGLRDFIDTHGRARTVHETVAAIRGSARFAEVTRLLSNRWYALSWAHDRGIEFPDAELAPIVERLSAHHRANGAGLLRRNSLTAGEYAAWVEREARFEWLIERGPEHLGLPHGGERHRTIDLALFPSEDPGVRVARAFLTQWARGHGIAAPEDDGSALLARWQATGNATSGDAAIVRDLALARWLVMSTPETFGFRAETLASALLELQATDRLAEVWT